jgi:hypothetical protein
MPSSAWRASARSASLGLWRRMCSHRHWRAGPSTVAAVRCWRAGAGGLRCWQWPSRSSAAACRLASETRCAGVQILPSCAAGPAAAASRCAGGLLGRCRASAAGSLPPLGPWHCLAVPSVPSSAPRLPAGGLGWPVAGRSASAGPVCARLVASAAAPHLRQTARKQRQDRSK